MRYEFTNLEKVLLQCSSRETAWPPCAEQWSPDKPASMHCAMYALFSEKHVGGAIEFVEAIYPDGSRVPHYRNIINARMHDFSQSQFPVGTTFSEGKIVPAKSLLALPDGEAERFALFERRVLAALGNNADSVK